MTTNRLYHLMQPKTPNTNFDHRDSYIFCSQYLVQLCFTDKDIDWKKWQNCKNVCERKSICVRWLRKKKNNWCWKKKKVWSCEFLYFQTNAKGKLSTITWGVQTRFSLHMVLWIEVTLRLKWCISTSQLYWYQVNAKWSWNGMESWENHYCTTT